MSAFGGKADIDRQSLAQFIGQKSKFLGGGNSDVRLDFIRLRPDALRRRAMLL